MFPCQRKKSGKKTSDENGNDTLDKDAHYWPNCDPTIWSRSCEQEIIEPIEVKHVGTMPKWLKGTLLRNGPGSLKVGNYKFEHIFDSSALLHKFEIREGTVTYQRRFVQTDTFKRNQAAQRIVHTEFGTKAVPDPCQTIFQRLKVASIFNPPEMSDNSMISVYPFGDEFYTFGESPFIHRINPETLETTKKIRLREHVRIVNHTSHPHVMPDGTVYNLGMSITCRGPAYNVVCFPPTKEIVDDSGGKRSASMFEQAHIVASISCRWTLNPSYMHTFGITDNYFIIIEQPLSVGLMRAAASHFKNDPLNSCLKWFDKENTLIHVVSRDSGLMKRTFVAEGFFYLHVINQYETDDNKQIVLDICCYKDARMLNCMYIDVMNNMHTNPDYANMFRARPLRFRLPIESFVPKMPRGYVASRSSELIEMHPSSKNPDTRENGNNDSMRKNMLHGKSTAIELPNGNIFVMPELLCDLGCETPRFNSDYYLGKEYRYFYAISSDVDSENPGTIIKVDTLTKTGKTWCEDRIFPGEPIFVPSPEAKSEDDGVVLSVLIWGKHRETAVGLLVLDAVTFQEIARATFETPGPVPKCLHGWFKLNP